VTPFLESQARGYERLDSRTAEHRDIRSPERRKTKGATIVEGNIHWRGLSVLKRLPLGAGGVNRIDKRLWRLLLGGDPASADAQISNTESKFMSSSNSRTCGVRSSSFKSMPAARAHPSKKPTALSRCRLQRTWSDQPRSAPVCLRQHSPAHNVTFLANHDAPYAAYDRRVFQVLAGYAQHHPFALAHLSCVGWIGRPPSGSILVCAFGGGSDGRRPLRPAKSGRCWNEDGSRSSAMRLPS